MSYALAQCPPNHNIILPFLGFWRKVFLFSRKVNSGWCGLVTLRQQQEVERECIRRASLTSPSALAIWDFGLIGDNTMLNRVYGKYDTIR